MSAEQILTLEKSWRFEKSIFRQISVTPVLTSHARLLLLLAQTALLSGCSGAPSLAIAGAYFPAWLACAVVGVITTVIARGLMASTHLTTVIPFQLAVCTAIGVLVALAVWLSWAVH
jgi:hypothetical protein